MEVEEIEEMENETLESKGVYFELVHQNNC